MSLVSEAFLFGKKGGGASTSIRPTKCEDQDDPAKGRTMIIFMPVNLKKLFKDQQKYSWPRPQCCPQCRISHVWGHGFVLAYFDDLPAGVFLRRYRCPQCGCIIRLRPKGFFRRLQAPIATVRTSLQQRLRTGRYLPDFSPNRQRHWFNNLKRNIKARLGDQWNNRLLAGFDLLVACGHVPVSSRI